MEKWIAIAALVSLSAISAYASGQQQTGASKSGGPSTQVVTVNSYDVPPYTTDPNFKLEEEQAKSDVGRPYPLGFTELHTKIAGWLQKAYLGQIGAQEALKNAQEEANGLLAKYNK